MLESQKRILFATCRPIVAVESGAETALREVMLALSKEGALCHAIGSQKQGALVPKGSWQESTGYTYANVLPRQFFSLVKTTVSEWKPSVIITQLDGSEEVMEIGSRENVPVVLFLHDVNEISRLSMTYAGKYKPALIVANSQYVIDTLLANYSGMILKMYPVRNLAPYIVRSQARKVGMVNPITWKGGTVFQALVRTMPDTEFIAVEGWHSPQTEGLFRTNFSNFTLLPHQNDMRLFYQELALLVVPSQWHEAFGRVVVEAAASGIPAIVSDSGGLPEALGDGGIVLPAHAPIDAWRTAIMELLDSPKKYADYSLAATKHARWIEEESKRSFAALRDCIMSL